MTDPSNRTTTPRSEPLRLLLGCALIALAAVAYRALFDYDPTRDRNLTGGDAAFFSPSGNAPLFVYGSAIWILYERRSWLISALGAPATLAPGFGLLLIAAVVSAWSYYIAAPDLLALSLPIAALGVAWWLGGKRACHAALLPAALITALIPIPAVVVNAVVYPLQLATSDLSVAILSGIGIETIQAADRFATATRTFQVIETCSGIRATQTLVLSAVIYQELFFRSRIQSGILILLAPILGLVVNQIRVMTLVFNPFSGIETVHTAQGIAMLVIGILLIAVLDSLLSRWIPKTMPPAAAPELDPVSPRRLALATLGMAVVAATTALPTSPNIERELDWNPHDIPLRMLSLRSEPVQLDRQFLGSTRFTKEASRRFRDEDVSVGVFVGATRRGERSSSPLSPKTLPLATATRTMDESPIELGPATSAATLATAVSPDGASRVLRWHANIASLPTEALRAFLGLDRGPAPRPGTPYVVRLSTPIDDSTEIPGADARLRQFGLELIGQIARLHEQASAQRAQRAATTRTEL